jgi:membrane fusion protein (multidrug efflux system)
VSETAKRSGKAQDTSEVAENTSKTGSAKLRWIGLAVLFLITVVGVIGYWRYAEIYPSTDNAYTGADIVRIAPLVAGQVIEVYVEDDQKVSEGDPLFDIDPVPYDAALRGALAQFDAAADAAGTEGEPLKTAAAEMEAKRQALVGALDAYRAAEKIQRDNGTSPGKAPSPAVADALEKVRKAKTAYRTAHQAFSEAQDKNMVVTVPTAKLRGAAAQLDKATEDRVKTHVLSPGDGWVSNVRVRPGAVMAAGTPAFPLVESGPWWVDANFKETDLARIRQGQPATIKLDMYPGYAIEGTVESISPGSGALFSVLPPENATGNWVKVTQRFPVRIKIDGKPDPKRPLRVGATANVTVDTSGSDKAGVKAEPAPQNTASTSTQ